MFTSECSKCGGTGNLSCYAAIAGGVCFQCGGKGKIVTRTKPQVGIRFAVSAVSKETGERVTVFWIKARNETAALKAAAAKLSCGNGYDSATTQVAQ